MKRNGILHSTGLQTMPIFKIMAVNSKLKASRNFNATLFGKLLCNLCCIRTGGPESCLKTSWTKGLALIAHHPGSSLGPYGPADASSNPRSFIPVERLWIQEAPGKDCKAQCLVFGGHRADAHVQNLYSQRRAVWAGATAFETGKTHICLTC